MLMTRWEPWAEMNRLRDEMDRLFGRYGLAQPRSFGASVFPPLNLWEDDNNLYVEAELPGFELDELEIYVTGENQLSIKGERQQPSSEGGTWHRQERRHGHFQRSIELPSQVDTDRVSAEFKHGVLRITLSKSPAARPRRIEVKTDGS
ncbi:MAG: Hsp20/alpha crystallin family protein [Planctomycetes bacterium]|jgi:HSP20 family protein|nr:Hsp20/alpha crystallin family protein [Planctomycetota bacterium]